MKNLKNFIRTHGPRALLPFMAMVLMSCKKPPIPEIPSENVTGDTTEISNDGIGGNNDVFYRADTIKFNWKDFPFGPHYDHLLSYIDDPMCGLLCVIPDTSAYSIDGSTWLNSEWWESVADWWEAYKYEFQGKITFQGGVIYVPQILVYPSDDTFVGMTQITAERFARLGVTIRGKNENGSLKSVKGKPDQTKNKADAMPWNTAQKMLRNKHREENYWSVTWCWNRYPMALCDDHIKRRIDEYGSIDLTPDSTWVSVLASCGFGPDQWRAIESNFLKFRKKYGNKVKYSGNIYHFPGWMPEETKHNLEMLNFYVEERSEFKSNGRPVFLPHSNAHNR